MLVEDGMNPGPPVVLPLDEWYDSISWHYGTPADLYDAINDPFHVVSLYIYWYDGRETLFVQDLNNDWIMFSRDGGDPTEVLPDFTLRGGHTLEIRFPTTPRVYYLYDDHTGIFGDEELTWFFEPCC